jgi:hypothetical protein
MLAVTPVFEKPDLDMIFWFIGGMAGLFLILTLIHWLRRNKKK